MIKKNLKWIIVAIAVILVLIVARGFMKNSGSGKDTVTASVTTVGISEVKREVIQTSIDYNGDVEAGEQAIINSNYGGKVEKILADNGDEVQSGETLAVLRTVELSNNVAIAEATLAKAQVAYNNSKTDYDRYKQLYEQGALSKKDMENAELAFKVAQADYNTAVATLSNMREILDDASISAPFSGVVANREIKIGQVLSPGQQVMSIENIDSVIINANVGQDRISTIKLGTPVEAQVSTFGSRVFKGQVTSINPAADPAARSFLIKTSFDNANHDLKPGMFASVNIKTGESHEAIVVPLKAVTGEEGMYFVFKTDGKKVSKIKVELGDTLEQSVEIKKGLVSGDKIVVTNISMLKDGDKIKVAKQ